LAGAPPLETDALAIDPAGIDSRRHVGPWRSFLWNDKCRQHGIRCHPFRFGGGLCRHPLPGSSRPSKPFHPTNPPRHCPKYFLGGGHDHLRIPRFEFRRSSRSGSTRLTRRPRCCSFRLRHDLRLPPTSLPQPLVSSSSSSSSSSSP